MKEIADILSESQYLDETLRNLLVKFVPYSLGVYSDARHEFQVHTVEVIEQAFADIVSGMQKYLEEAQAKLETQKNNRETLEAEATKAEDNVAKLKEALQAKDNELKEAAQVLSGKKKLMKEVESMQADAEQEMESIENNKSEKDSLEKAANEWIRPLKEGSLEGEEHKEAAKQLTELLRELCEEETMLACL